MTENRCRRLTSHTRSERSYRQTGQWAKNGVSSQLAIRLEHFKRHRQDSPTKQESGFDSTEIAASGNFNAAIQHCCAEARAA